MYNSHDLTPMAAPSLVRGIAASAASRSSVASRIRGLLNLRASIAADQSPVSWLESLELTARAWRCFAALTGFVVVGQDRNLPN
jgi:hypothetical protein